MIKKISTVLFLLFPIISSAEMNMKEAVQSIEPLFSEQLSQVGFEKFVFAQAVDKVNFDYSRRKWTISIQSEENDPVTDRKLLLICHELGHLLAQRGADLVNGEPEREIDSDFWAAKSCAPKVWSRIRKSLVLKENKLPTKIRRATKNLCKNQNQPLKCERTAKAAYRYREGSIEKEQEKSEFTYPLTVLDNLKCTPKRKGKYPSINQCSFNTLLSGASDRLKRPDCLNLIMTGLMLNENGVSAMVDLDEQLKCD